MYKKVFYMMLSSLISLSIISMEPNLYLENDKLPIKNYLDLRKLENYQILTPCEQKVIRGIQNLNSKETSLALIALLSPKLKNDKPTSFIDEKLISLIESKLSETLELRSLAQISGLDIDFEYLQEKKASQAPLFLHAEYTAKQQYQDAYAQEKSNTSAETIKAWKEYENRKSSIALKGSATIFGAVGSLFLSPVFTPAIFGFLLSPLGVVYYSVRELNNEKTKPFPNDPTVYYPERTKNALQNYQSIKNFNLTKFD